MGNKFTVTRTMTDDHKFTDTYPAYEDFESYVREALRSSLTKSVTIEVAPANTARFTLYNFGERTEGGSHIKATAHEWGNTTYGHHLVKRLQAEIDDDPTSHSRGEMHSVIPDLNGGDTYGRRFSVLIESID